MSGTRDAREIRDVAIHLYKQRPQLGYPCGYRVEYTQGQPPAYLVCFTAGYARLDENLAPVVTGLWRLFS